MRIVFCDDDPAILRQLLAYVKEFFTSLGGLEPEYAVYRSGDELIRHETKFDIAFLDVEMPGASGIHTGAKLKEKNPRIKIFIVTAYPDYLDEAMRANLHSVRIIHGKGTGTLRTAVHQALRKNRFVKKFRLGIYGEGEDGVTIAEFD